MQTACSALCSARQLAGEGRGAFESSAALPQACQHLRQPLLRLRLLLLCLFSFSASTTRTPLPRPRHADQPSDGPGHEAARDGEVRREPDANVAAGSADGVLVAVGLHDAHEAVDPQVQPRFQAAQDVLGQPLEDFVNQPVSFDGLRSRRSVTTAHTRVTEQVKKTVGLAVERHARWVSG